MRHVCSQQDILPLYSTRMSDSHLSRLLDDTTGFPTRYTTFIHSDVRASVVKVIHRMIHLWSRSFGDISVLLRVLIDYL